MEKNEQDEARARLEGALLSKEPAEALDALVRSGEAEELIPELPALKLEMKPGHRHKDVYLHTLKVVEQAAMLEKDGPDLTLRWAALLHDVGKPATRQFEAKGEVTFHGHDLLGAKMTKRRLRTLGYPEPFVKDVARLVELHLRTFGYTPGKWTDSGVRRYVHDAGDLLDRLNVLIRADVTTGKKERRERLHAGIDHLEAEIERVRAKDEAAALRPDLTGEDVMRLLNIPPGPEVGKVMRHLLALKRDGAELTREEAEAEARKAHSA